jgi:hypothetical protein
MPEPVSQQNNVQYAQPSQGQYMSTIQQPTNNVQYSHGPTHYFTMPQQTNVPYSSAPFQMQYSSAPPQVVQYAAAPGQMQYASAPVQQQVVQYAPAPVQQEMMSRPVPKCAWDVRTVLVPKMVTEEYVEMQPRIVAVALNVPMQRQKWLSIQRQISIPRPMVEKRVLRKMVPKVIQVEETYEVEAECMEEEFFYANTSAQYRSSGVFTGAAGYGETYMQSAQAISATQSPSGAAYGQFAGAIKSPNLSAQTELAVSAVSLF